MKKQPGILLKRDGQSQLQRFPEELDPGYARPDGRSLEEYLELAKNFAQQVNYFQTSNNVPDGTWAEFFNYDPASVDGGDQKMPPHLALFNSFLKNYGNAVDQLNGITGRHLDFYYKQVLGLREKAPVPDKAHVVIELKKNIEEEEIPKGTLYKAGKDQSGKELLYEQTETFIANTGKIESLRSVYVDSANHDRVHMAPVANSSDGLGGKINTAEPHWPAFGNKELPKANIGFALSSPLLLLQEGVRKISITLRISGLPARAYNKTVNKNLFQAYLSGAEGWLGPTPVTIVTDEINQQIRLNLELSAEEPAVIAYDPALHGGAFSSAQPLVQFFLNNEKDNQGYAEWKDAVLQKAKIEVSAGEIKGLSLENDSGVLDPKKPFFPFGTSPGRHSNFHIGYPEAFGKKLSEFDLTLEWKEVPANLTSHYAAYNTNVNSNSHFKADVYIRDGGGWEETETRSLFNGTNAAASQKLSFSKIKKRTFQRSDYTLYQPYSLLSRQKTSWAKDLNFQSKLLYHWVLFDFGVKPDPRSGFITMQLANSFLHREFRELYPIRMMEQAGITNVNETLIPKEPYTPQLQSVTLDYKAYSSEIDFSAATLEAFGSEEIQLFHLGAFGQMREHAYQKKRFESDTRIFLLPQYRDEGEFYIGLSGLRGGQGLSILFQAAEGSADPETDPPGLSWQVLTDNYWRTLNNEELLSDATEGLLGSGIVRFVLPPEATLTNSVLPPGYIWLKCRAGGGTRGVCRLKEALAGAVLLRFKDRENDPGHLTTPLAAGGISGFLEKSAGVKAVAQPYASFGGAPAENLKKFRTRVSERLRHKKRAVSIWDYERLLLEAFPEVYKVKCIPHASEKSFLAPGHVTLVLIPDLNNQNAVDPLRPKVSNKTRKKALEFLDEKDNRLCSHFAELHVLNPDYEQVQLDFQVKFRTGFEFNYYAKKLKQEIREYLSPWAYGRVSELSFGGRIYRSVLLDFVEELEYVDFVSEFKMYRHRQNKPDFTDLYEVSAQSPRSVLVSHEEHIVHPYTG